MFITNDFEAQSELQRELLADEKLLWTGRPKKGILFRLSDVFFIPFSILWCGFAIFWETSVLSTNAPFFFKLWGIPFVCAGLYITVGRFFYDKLNRDKTIYGITNQRVIIKSGVFNTTIESFNIKTLFNLSIDEKTDGSGTIKLDSDQTNPFSFYRGAWPGNKKAPALELIQNVRTVYNLVLQQQRN